MSIKQFLTLSSLGTAIFLSTCITANAVSFVSLPDSYTDADFITTKNDGLFEEDWVAEARSGNSQTNGDYELSINNWTTNNNWNVATQQQLDWRGVKGTPINFTISYDGTNAIFNVGGQTLNSTNLTESARFPDGINSIYLRTYATINGTTTSSSMSISDLVVDGKAYNDTVSSDSSTDSLDYLLITGLDDNFSLTGKATVNWTGSDKPPSGSRLAFQAKMGYSSQYAADAVPEPLTMTGTLLGGAFLYLSKKRKAQKSVFKN